MNEAKYVGLDVHQSSTVAAVHNERGKRVMESILETQSETIQSFLKGLTGTVHVTFEEGTPQDKYAAVVNWSLDRFCATARATRYGSVLDPGTTEALDVDLSQPLSDEEFTELEQAFFRGQVLVLRGQTLAPAQFALPTKRRATPWPNDAAR